jgi:VanZ family protein
MRSSPGLKRLWFWGPVIAYVALIFFLSGMSDISWSAPYPDYVLHAAEYIGLAILVVRALNGGLQRAIPPRTMLLAFLFCALYAISDEIHQMFVPNRYADYIDVLSDVGGAAIGLVGLHFMQRMVLRRNTA